MSYQPFIWIFFYLGVRHLLRKHGGRIPVVLRSRTMVAGVAFVILGVVVGLRWWRLGGTASERVLAVTVTSAPRYVSEVSSTFRGLRSFLETLPADETLLIGAHESTGRWNAISRRNYYVPDSALASVVRSKDVYLLAECGTLEVCQSWPFWKDVMRRRVEEFGEFAFDSVFAAASPRARVEVFRIRTR